MSKVNTGDVYPKVLARMKQCGISIKDKKLLGFSRQTVAHWKTGVNPTIHVLRRLAILVAVPPEILLEGTEAEVLACPHPAEGHTRALEAIGPRMYDPKTKWVMPLNEALGLIFNHLSNAEMSTNGENDESDNQN